jgi:hypothetical protein
VTAVAGGGMGTASARLSFRNAIGEHFAAAAPPSRGPHLSIMPSKLQPPSICHACMWLQQCWSARQEL